MKSIAIVTGASSGMGKEFALTLNDHAYSDEIWLIARNRENLEQTARQIEVPCKIIPLDLTDPNSFIALEELLKAENPRVSLLVNASGFGIFHSVEDSRMKDLEGMVDLNCKALVKITKLVLPYLTQGSKIIQIASMAAFQPIPYINVYGASKAFVLSFSRALNREVGKRGVHCMAVCPYWTRTAFFERAIDRDAMPVVKKYIVMYQPEKIIKQAWKDLDRNRDVSIYGLVARGQAALCKILPHWLVMDIWQKQQDL